MASKKKAVCFPPIHWNACLFLYFNKEMTVTAFPPPPAVRLGDWWAVSPFYEAVKCIFFSFFKSRLGFILQVDTESQKGKMHRWSEIQTTGLGLKNTLISILCNIHPSGVSLSTKKIFFNWMLWGKSLPTIHWCMAEHFIFEAVVAKANAFSQE